MTDMAAAKPVQPEGLAVLKQLVANDSSTLVAVQRLKAAGKGKHFEDGQSSENRPKEDDSLQSNSRASEPTRGHRVKFFPYPKHYPTFGKSEYKVSIECRVQL